MDGTLIDIIIAIVVISTFIAVLFLIVTDKLNRAIAALTGAIIIYFTLIFIKGDKITIFIDLTFGTGGDYENLHALVLILGMLFIVEICLSAGVFQFISFQLIKMTKGNPMKLLLAICSITLLVSSVLGGILAIIVLIPITFVVARILNIDPIPYVFSQALLIPIGEIFFSISSVPVILITTSAGVGFVEYFLNVGLFCLILFLVTIVYVNLSYRNKLVAPKANLVAVLMKYNAWNYVPNKGTFYRSAFALIAILVCFMVIPPPITPDIIAITGAIVLVVVNKLNGREIIQKLDLELLLYLLGIFFITGAMDHIQIIESIGQGLKDLVGGNPLLSLLTVLWLSAFLSSVIDDIPVAKVLIPIVGIISFGQPHTLVNSSYYSLAFGTALGDNLTPLGDTVIIKNISEQHGYEFSMGKYFKLGLKIGVIHLIAVSIYFTFFFNSTIGLIIILCIAIVISLTILLQYLNKRKKPHIQPVSETGNAEKNPLDAQENPEANNSI